MTNFAQQGQFGVAAAVITGTGIIAAIKSAGVRFVASVPDRVTSEGVLRRMADDPEISLVRVCKEDEGVSICAALSYCNKRALLLMQHTGLMDSLNMLQWSVSYSMPIVMIVGLLGHESDVPPAASAKRPIRAIPGVLDAIGIEHEFLHAAGDERRIRPAFDRAYSQSKPIALLIGRTPQ